MRMRRGHTEFFSEGGEVHPIRDSPGYSKDVEEVSERERHHAERERHYRGIQRGRSEVHRPEWARGMTDQQVRSIARQAGVSAEREHWWHGLQLQKGSGEYQSMVSESGVRHDRQLGARMRRGGGRERKQSRAEQRAIATRSALGGADLPF